MSLLSRNDRGRPVADRRRTSTASFRPLFEGLEDRTVLSTIMAGHAPIVHAAVAHLHHPGMTAGVAGAHVTHGHVAGHHGNVGAHAAVHHGVPHHGHVKHGQTTSPTLTPTATFTSTTTKSPAVSGSTTDSSIAAATMNPPTTDPSSTNVASAALATSALSASAVTTATTPPATGTTLADPQLLQVNLQPIDLKLLGLEVTLDGGTAAGATTPSPVVVTVSSQPGNGELLGNLLTVVSNLVNLQGANNALNTVLGSVVSLLNTTSLAVSGVNTNGTLGSTTAVTTVPVLNLFVAPIHLNLLGAVVDTSPIHLAITAHTGPGLVLGDIVADLANLLNTPPKNGKLTLDYLTQQLGSLLDTVSTQLPGFVPPLATTAPATPAPGTEQVLSLTVPPINVNLLGLVLKTSQIQVNANATSGNGDLLGNLLSDLLTAVDATPTQLNTLSAELNRLLGTVVNVLNVSALTPIPSLSSLSPTLYQLATTNLTGAPFPTTPSSVLNLNISTVDGTPPVDVNLLGLVVTTGNIQVQLLAQPGTNQILGNLVYNVSNLLNPGGSLNVLPILGVLGL